MRKRTENEKQSTMIRDALVPCSRLAEIQKGRHQPIIDELANDQGQSKACWLQVAQEHQGCCLRLICAYIRDLAGIRSILADNLYRCSQFSSYSLTSVFPMHIDICIWTSACCVCTSFVIYAENNAVGPTDERIFSCISA